ncbi:outer membrane receptor protein involved in Fe transport [Rhizobium leguminosarum]|uniref:Outer membrane receptor protein involved in Fe transport n=1 Tax=Rhizobium leguminosarum TaxID=384 RepID=A0AAE2MF97_RHILE|nr:MULTISPECIES: hypothetical protein [Rhizobium]MBB4288234.1 outer membrane receptor protein involved in Fe transport [Rhizobium leguminosarum]MBB4295675.1 outer membrane receptor protein involved in Fe transport [Rhizobium leguminosarum]MBB4307067.1 outer membrane receptor protein involved in Fe transport [Rhizobium leguminosarum]MBB4417350.1 outer membrane receptor protein involved in Fe transport [Rhizobium leguminosarum]MBB4432194.1 outer membrane receptor protein involved in Fe transport
MTTTFKTGLIAATLSAMLGLSALSAAAAPLQSSATEQGATARPVANQETKVEHDRRTTGSIGERAAETTGSTHYMMNPKKPLNMDCKLGFNPTSSSSCNY